MMRWLRRFRAWLAREPSLPTVTVGLSKQEFEVLHWWSGQSGQSIELLIVELVTKHIPNPIRHAHAREASNREMLHRIEHTEEMTFQASLTEGVFPLAPTAIPPKLPEPVPRLSKETVKRRLQIAHACMHLDEGDLTPFHLRPGDAQGVCHAPQRSDVPCHWPTNAAPSCLYFQAKYVRKMA